MTNYDNEAIRHLIARQFNSLCWTPNNSAAWRSSPPSKLPDQIASVFLLLALFCKQIDYLFSV